MLRILWITVITVLIKFWYYFFKFLYFPLLFNMISEYKNKNKIPQIFSQKYIINPKINWRPSFHETIL
jgi:hypothetical protein